MGFCLRISLPLLIGLSGSAARPPDLPAERSFYLDSLLQRHDYRPAKNSFLLRNLAKGEKHTVLDLSGSGSIRHIWSTWSIPESESTIAPQRVFLRVFVDGSSTASISGPFDDLCRAAEATGTRYLPFAAFNYKGAFNLYLPIFFKTHIRMEIEAIAPIQEFYTQIDYRLTPREESAARLVSRATGARLFLDYIGENPPGFRRSSNPPTRTERKDLHYAPNHDAELIVNGPATLKQITFRGELLDDLSLEIYWDSDKSPSVDAPLRYFFADFNNAAMESSANELTCHFRMPFHDRARILLRSLSGNSGRVNVEYSLENNDISAKLPYFHAQFRKSEQTTGYSQYAALRVSGDGLFVGINLFDSGHNHGGGDSALIDAGTPEPLVLHGICGEDYFSFAWHQTGTMTPLTGAPVHARRYRLHLENPYPFHESFQFLFGMFAGLEPKSVAFWYQFPQPAHANEWTAFNIRWNVIGPLGLDTPIPQNLSPAPVHTLVPIKDPTPLEEQWQSADMLSGFLDLTYQFRHYAMIASGTGFVPGPSRTQLVTHILSPSQQTVDVLLGHDDQALAAINGQTVATLSARAGFGASHLRLPLRRGPNILQVTLWNDENNDWRWCGLSLAFSKSQAQGLRFSSQPPAIGKTL